MKKKKRYIVIFIILAIYVALMYYFVGKDNLKKGTYSTTIVVGDSSVWNYSNKNWLNITVKTSLKKLNWQEFNVYQDNEYFGKYYLWHDDKWYLFDLNKKAVQKSGNMLAYRSNYDLKVKSFTENEITDMSYVQKVLQDNDLSISQQFTKSNEVNFDIDNDGVEEQFYIISNVFAMDFVPDKLFSIVFMVKDDKISYLYKEIVPNNVDNGCKPYINSFLNADNDGNYEVIVSCGKYSVEKPVDMLYGYNAKDGFKILISNQ